MPLLAARKVFPIFSNWVHCFALLSPDCGSVLFPIGGMLSLNSYYANDLSCLLYSSLLLFTASSPFTAGLSKYKLKLSFESQDNTTNLISFMAVLLVCRSYKEKMKTSIINHSFIRLKTEIY